ncbi:hypothetical protein GCM10020358_49700 [Amorphoplanes nipponensis]|uniref:DUF5919 domain-containing protein n=1 Tax=Actinoplanes nipponensis TaxID=135950 RepID=A0A919MXC0_9ACTN|nr:hypothetical protein Ani05nite_66390 [Actinoplanes nipponensis]
MRRALVPNRLLGLILVSGAALLFAVFVFGTRGKYPDPDTAELLRTVSVGILAAAVATVIDRQISLGALEKQIYDSLLEAEGVKSSLARLGVHGAHHVFDFGRPFREAHKGEVVSWLDTYCPRQNELIDDLVAAVDRGVHVRMLIIDPRCATAGHRDAELVGSLDTGEGWKAGLEAFIHKMTAAASRGHGRFEIRFYDDLPCVPMYLVGRGSAARVGYFSLFLTRPSAHFPHLELRSGAWLVDMAAYFEAKWSRHADRAITAGRPVDPYRNWVPGRRKPRNDPVRPRDTGAVPGRTGR